MPAKSRRGKNKSAAVRARRVRRAGPVRRLVRRLVLAIVIVIVMPVVLLPVYSAVNPPITTVMIAKRVAGASIIKTWRPIEAISPHLVRAVIVAEDARFCAHSGIGWQQVEEVLKDPDRRRAMGERNFELGKKYFSYSSLIRGLSALLTSFFGTIPSGNLAGGPNGQ